MKLICADQVPNLDTKQLSILSGVLRKSQENETDPPEMPVNVSDMGVRFEGLVI